MPVPTKEDTAPTSNKPVEKPIAASRSAHNISGLDEKTPPSKSGSQASLSTRTSERKTKSPSGLPTKKAAAARSKSAQDLGSIFKGKKRNVGKESLESKPKNGSTRSLPKSNSENSSIRKKSAPAIAKDVPDSPRNPEEAENDNVGKTSSEYTESVTSSSSDDHAKRTNADGNERGASENSPRSTVSGTCSTNSSVSSEGSTETPDKPISSNANNNNANPKTNGGLKKNGSRLPTPTKSSSRSAISSGSSHSVGSPERVPTSAPQVRSPLRGGSVKSFGKRDGIPAKSYTKHQPPKRSASEQLQLTRPPPPNYPLRNYQPGYPVQPNSHGYNMDQYKAAMAASIRAPYPGHPADPGMSQGRGAPSHGFDTAV